MLDHLNLSPDSILKIWVVWTPNHVNKAQGKILLLYGLVSLIVAMVEPWVGSDIGLFFLILFLVNELLQVSISDQFVKENL